MGKNVGKSIRKNVCGKYRPKLLHHAKQFATDAFKSASKRTIQKTAEATGDLTGNKIVNKVTNISKNHNNIIQR